MSTSRSIRRAAERRARKLARKGQPVPNNEFLTSPEAELEPTEITAEPEAPVTIPEPPTAVSEARLRANRANSQLSTGPTSSLGREKSSKNALKTALTGRTVLLPGDDADHYAARLAEYDRLYRPVGIREVEIIQALADTWWRLDRIPGLMQALYAKGSTEFAEKVANLEPDARATMLRLETYLAYERQFRNLEIQEGRLYRYAQKLKAELAELQKHREQREAEELAHASMLYLAAKKDRKPFTPADHGFEFSSADIEAYLHGRNARKLSEESTQVRTKAA